MTDLNFIFSRRSIRRFTTEKVSEAHIRSLLEAAMAAPTAMNMKPWHFVVVDDPSKLAELRATLPFGKMEAPLAISVCGNMQSIKRPVLERFWVQDCSAATENLLLAANALGLGAVWCGVHPLKRLEDALSRTLNLPEAVIPLNVIYIGHPAEEKPARTQYDQTRISQNLFDIPWETPVDQD
jgi:nitroreductase